MVPASSRDRVDAILPRSVHVIAQYVELSPDMQPESVVYVEIECIHNFIETAKADEPNSDLIADV